MDALLTKARFEEAKIRGLVSNQQQRQKSLSLDFQVLVSMTRLQNHQSIRKQALVRNKQRDAMVVAHMDINGINALRENILGKGVPMFVLRMLRMKSRTKATS